MININSRAEKVKHKIEKGNERYSKTSNSFDTGFFFSEQKIGARQRERVVVVEFYNSWKSRRRVVRL